MLSEMVLEKDCSCKKNGWEEGESLRLYRVEEVQFGLSIAGCSEVLPRHFT